MIRPGSGAPDFGEREHGKEGPGAAGPSAAPDRGGGAGTGRRALVVAFSIALFAAILWFGGVESWRALLSGDPWLYFLVFLLTGVAPALSAWRLRTLVQAATGAGRYPWRRFFHINMTAIALGLFLPRNAALLGGKAAYLRTMGVPVLRGTWAILTENLVDLVFLVGIGLPCVLVLVVGLDSTGFIVSFAACYGLLIVAVLWIRQRDWRAFASRLVHKVPWVSSKLPIPEGGFVPGAVRAVPMLGVTVLIHLFMAARAYAIALAIGVDAPWLVFAAAYPITQLGLVLAVAPGALGTLDASWVGLLILGGVTNADALSFTLAMRACIIVFPVIWYGLSVLLSLTIVPNEALESPLR